MADNTELNTGSGGDTAATLEASFSGDTAKFQAVSVFGASGSEGSWTLAPIGGDATNGLEVDVTRVGGSVTVVGAAAEDAAASGNPVLAGGRYDSTPRALESGDAGAIALTPEGYVMVEAAGAAIDGTTTNTHGTSEGSPIMAVATPTTGSVDANDFGMVAMSTDRRLLVDAQIAGQDANLTVDLGATDNAVLDAIAASLAGTLGVSGTVTANLSATDNAVLDAIAASLAGTLTVGSHAVTNAGTFATQAAQSGTWNITNVSGTVSLPTGASTAANQSTANTALQLIDNMIVAHDAAVTGSTGVAVVGARATNNIEGITQVANADATRVQADLNGVLITRPHTTLEEILKERVANTNGTSTDFTTFAAGGSGVHNYVTTISIYNSSATDGYVDFRDGAAGSVIFTAAAPATGGSVINLPVPLKGADNTALAYDVSGALDTVYISVVGFQAQG